MNYYFYLGYSKVSQCCCCKIFRVVFQMETSGGVLKVMSHFVRCSGQAMTGVQF